ncbi:MAG: RnfABCDGE type electron transport complex subunit B [Bacilli bacterium]|jgi:electron transport complex, rnfABCDGE type, B subunit
MSIVIAIILVTLTGLLCSVMLVVASHFMMVPTNEKEEKLRNCLPGANCGACGYTGCDSYAKALAEDETVKTNLCVPGADKVAKELAEVLGVKALDVVEKVAFIHCFGDCTKRTKKNEYEGLKSCLAAKSLYGGEADCTYGCIGYGDCAKVCPVDAICVENGIAHIDQRKCIGCGLCEKTCPNHLITLFADKEKVAVTCSNHEKGAVARKKCTNACIKCKKCENTCPTKAITVKDNLAQIDYRLCINCGKCVEVCPTHCIIKADLTGMHHIEEQ